MGSLRYNEKVDNDLLDVKNLVHEIYQCSEDLMKNRFRDDADNIKLLCEELANKMECFDTFNYYDE